MEEYYRLAAAFPFYNNAEKKYYDYFCYLAEMIRIELTKEIKKLNFKQILSTTSEAELNEFFYSYPTPLVNHYFGRSSSVQLSRAYVFKIFTILAGIATRKLALPLILGYDDNNKLIMITTTREKLGLVVARGTIEENGYFNVEINENIIHAAFMLSIENGKINLPPNMVEKQIAIIRKDNNIEVEGLKGMITVLLDDTKITYQVFNEDIDKEKCLNDGFMGIIEIGNGNAKKCNYLLTTKHDNCQIKKSICEGFLYLERQLNELHETTYQERLKAKVSLIKNEKFVINDFCPTCSKVPLNSIKLELPNQLKQQKCKICQNNRTKVVLILKGLEKI